MKQIFCYLNDQCRSVLSVLSDDSLMRRVAAKVIPLRDTRIHRDKYLNSSIADPVSSIRSPIVLLLLPAAAVSEVSEAYSEEVALWVLPLVCCRVWAGWGRWACYKQSPIGDGAEGSAIMEEDAPIDASIMVRSAF